jgi:hypothetical protein
MRDVVNGWPLIVSAMEILSLSIHEGMSLLKTSKCFHSCVSVMMTGCVLTCHMGRAN